jgi:hypothetical protein
VPYLIHPLLADLSVGEWGTLAGALVTAMSAVGVGLKWIIDRFLTELGKRDASLGEMTATMRSEGGANREAVQALREGFEAKLNDIGEKFGSAIQRITDRQFTLAGDSLTSTVAVKAEVGEVRRDVAEVKKDVAEVKAEVHEVRLAVDRIGGPPEPPAPPQQPPRPGGGRGQGKP